MIIKIMIINVKSEAIAYYDRRYFSLLTQNLIVSIDYNTAIDSILFVSACKRY